jgi:hypothetical protein
MSRIGWSKGAASSRSPRGTHDSFANRVDLLVNGGEFSWSKRYHSTRTLKGPAHFVGGYERVLVVCSRQWRAMMVVGC